MGGALAGLVDAARRHAVLTLLAALALTAASVAVAAGHLGINANTDDLFDADLPFRRLDHEFYRAFPVLDDSVLVVVDAPTRPAAEAAVRALAARVEAEPETFASVWTPGVGPFFERNGLLYLETGELDRLAGRLIEAQPFLAELARDPSLRGLFGQLERAVEMAGGRAGEATELGRIFGAVEGAITDAERAEARPRSFGAVVLQDPPEAASGRRFAVVQPRVDYGDFVPGHRGIDRLHAIFVELGLDGSGETRARTTGELALQAEELEVVRQQAAGAGVASLVLVAVILGFALRSPRVIAAVLATLVLGLVWTAGFAGLAVGHLNLISVAFAVLFIGLGVDFGIHFSARYQELRASGHEHAPALRETARSVGSSLALCAFTTAIGFYAFVPTGYRGVAELGIISGSGLLISLVGSLTVLPALMSLGTGGRGPRSPASPPGQVRLSRFPVRRPATVAGVALVLGLVAAGFAPRLHFDANPLHVRDPGAESVRTFRDLIEGGSVNPWSIDVLTPDLASAEALAARLETLPSVAEVRTLRSYVPSDQVEKLEILGDLELLLGPALTSRPLPPPTLAEQVAAVRGLRDALRGLGDGSPLRAVGADPLADALDRFLEELGARGEPAAAALEAALVAPVAERIAELRTALQAGPVDAGSLPEAIRERMLAPDGRAHVEVLPAEDLNDDAALRRFVREVRDVAPGATGSSVYMFESANAIVRALTQAFATATLLVTALLWLLWRSTLETALALAPLLLAAVLTAAASVLIGPPINFADVIVLPLLLGIGVDSGIHLVHRYRHEGVAAEALLGTSTSRAVLWSALTTIASFGSLAFASHLGLASLGQLLTLGVVFTLLANLVVLPALLVLAERIGRRG